MAKKSKRTHASQKCRKRNKASSAPQDPAKRDTLRWLRNGGAAVVAVGAAGYIGSRAVRAHVYTHDLSRIGQGIPMIVQIHDPSCPTCNTLKRRVQRAMDGFDDRQLQYVVADIKTTEGAVYASRHGVPHVTLLYVDGQGQVMNITQGLMTVDELRSAFAAHAGADPVS